MLKIEMSLSTNPIRLNKGIRHREKCDSEGELKEGNHKRINCQGKTFQISFFGFGACNGMSD